MKNTILKRLPAAMAAVVLCTALCAAQPLKKPTPGANAPQLGTPKRPAPVIVENPNLITPGAVRLTASSAGTDTPPKRIMDARPTAGWETSAGKQGAWIKIDWAGPQRVSELWIVGKSAPYDLLFDPESRTQHYSLPRNVRLEFGDGTLHTAELRETECYQIVRLGKPLTASSVKIAIESLYPSPSPQTGVAEVCAFAEPNAPRLRIDCFQMFDVQEGKPVQSAKIEIVNPGSEIRGAKLQVLSGGKPYATLPLETVPGRAVTTQQLWLPALYDPTELTFRLRGAGAEVFAPYTALVQPYRKDYFDGGRFEILSTNHNDLGWLDIQSKTADYRSYELISPALDLLREHPEYRYHMESLGYLREFVERCPQRRDEIAQRMREGRFTFGASYTQNLQAHVGEEKLVRHFYYGRRWLLETFPGCDSRFYSNVDVPGFTFQLPQVLKKAGVDYLIQGRFPWGFYYWQGADGTTIPVFALRYTGARTLLNPVNHTGWIRLQSIRAPYYSSRKLPRSVIYDYNCDYLPPAPQMIPYVKEQNRTMKEFAASWNTHFRNEPDRQITPPTLGFVSPTEALDDFFGQRPALQTLRGDWPMSWAYFDEPGHREGLRMGREGHNRLLQAEGMFAWLKAADPASHYPQQRLDSGWLANCWPDHGWGGNRGPVTDSFNVASYQKALEIGNALTREAGRRLAATVPATGDGRIPLVVYNAAGWTRDEVVSGTIALPEGWTGMELTDASGTIVPYETTERDASGRSITVAFAARQVPSVGYRVYYARPAAAFTGIPTAIAGDSIENDRLKVRFGSSGIASLFDKESGREVLRTDKFEGAEVIQLTAPTVAWDCAQESTTANFDRTANHPTRTLRAVESPVRYLIEKETVFPDFTLRQRFILNKQGRELTIEADLIGWKGVPERELRAVFPINQPRDAQISYEVPFATVEAGRDELDYSLLPETVESNFKPAYYARTDLPFREAVNWVDVSSGQYRGNGCLLASDVTLHLFRDQTDSPVEYPVVQHVLLSSRKSMSWNPEQWFTQPGDHSYRMSLRPHDGNWRLAYRDGRAFNIPLTLYTAPQTGKRDGATRAGDTFAERVSAEGNSTGSDATGSASAGSDAMSFLEIGPSNLILSAVKQAEDGNGFIVRLYEAEGNRSTLRLKGFRPFTKASLTNLIEYDQRELPVATDGTLQMEIAPREIVTLRVQF